MIIVDIRESDLKNACEQGKALWRQIASMSKRSPKGDLRIRVQWTITHQLWASVAYPEFYGWAMERGLIPQLRANLYGANLSWANLSGANLSWANLSWANLSEANLYGANLSGAYRLENPPSGWKIVNRYLEKI